MIDKPIDLAKYCKDLVPTLAVFLLEFLFLQWASMCVICTLVYLLFYTSYYWIPAIYLAWYFYDLNTSCYRGGYAADWCRRWRWWTYYCQYFPMKLHKTVDIGPDDNYLFCMHPHGIMCLSGFGNFCTEGSNFSGLFPGLKPHVLMLKWLFFMPLTRELLMLSGASAVTKLSFVNILDKPIKSGEVAVVVAGGAAEALEAERDRYKIILKNRKGFIRMALQTGASLVPVFSFGENDLFNQAPNPTGSPLRRLQDKLKRMTGIGFPAWSGRGFFSEKSFGIVAFNRPVNTVVGKPIRVEKNAAATDEDVDALHRIYVCQVVELFEQNKAKFCEKPVELEIM